ncbi:hypothetical protein PYK79_17945 [Streptomyces sp. ID05-04B]|uniref:hypothetical protein n=1 Tax=unclassified Streptomyces TaxID=2593676 RepID=UPI001C20048F|nr:MULTISPECIES: hypothetical protein [unclassified Streptomyces]MDX5564847.1 hypothetical protein [Streptomyces sp. ID05-04B]
MNETNAGGVRQRSAEIVVPVHPEAHVLAEGTGRLPVHLAIGRRLNRRAAVVPGAEREFVSRACDLPVGAGPRTRFPEAQCGFRAAIAGVTCVPALLPLPG